MLGYGADVRVEFPIYDGPGNAGGGSGFYYQNFDGHVAYKVVLSSYGTTTSSSASSSNPNASSSVTSNSVINHGNIIPISSLKNFHFFEQNSGVLSNFAADLLFFVQNLC